MNYDIVILGSGPAGLTAAIYASRAGVTTLLVEGIFPGGQLTITTDIENFPGFPTGIKGPKLMELIRKQAERFGAEFRSGDVSSVSLAKRPFKVTTDSGEVSCRALVVATGSYARWLGLTSEQELMGRGVSACATCDGFFFKGQEIAVVGGGDTAMEEALFLASLASKVTVIHRRGELRASRILQERAFGNPRIAFRWHSIVDEVLSGEGGVAGVRLKDTRTGELSEIRVTGLFIAIGHEPNTRIFRGQLELDDQGYIVTRPGSMSTSVAGVFAAGDVRDRMYKQAVTAAGTGCMAALEACRLLQSEGGTT